MEDLLAGDGEHAGEDALGEAGAQHDAVVGLVHPGFLVVGFFFQPVERLKVGKI